MDTTPSTHAPLAVIAAALFLTGCNQSVPVDQINVERASTPTIPVVVYEVPLGSVNADITEWRDQHGRACTAARYAGEPAIDCDFPPATAPPEVCPKCSE